jgi:translation initiation factor 2 beta subunit (eIF-2beta)/eIF-5
MHSPDSCLHFKKFSSCDYYKTIVRAVIREEVALCDACGAVRPYAAVGSNQQGVSTCNGDCVE